MRFVGVKRACSGVRISISISNLPCGKDDTGDHRLLHSMVLFSLCGHSSNRPGVSKSVTVRRKSAEERNIFPFHKSDEIAPSKDECRQGVAVREVLL